MRTLIGEKQAQVGKDPVLTDKPQCALLLLPKRDMLLREKPLRILKGQFLIQGPGRLILIAVRLLDHFQNGAPGDRDGRRPLPDKDPLRAESLGRKVVGTGGALLDADRNNVLSVYLPLLAQQKHGNVWFDGVPQGIGHFEHGPVHFRNTDDCAVVLHANQNLAAPGVGESDDRLFDIFRVLPFEFCGNSFCHRNSPRIDDTTIIRVLTRNVKKNDSNHFEPIRYINLLCHIAN